MKYPDEVQQEWLKKLITQAQNTEIGEKYDFKSINNYQTYKNRVPAHDY